MAPASKGALLNIIIIYIRNINRVYPYISINFLQVRLEDY